jgi:hypothetical protein
MTSTTLRSRRGVQAHRAALWYEGNLNSRHVRTSASPIPIYNTHSLYKKKKLFKRTYLEKFGVEHFTIERTSKEWTEVQIFRTSLAWHSATNRFALSCAVSPLLFPLSERKWESKLSQPSPKGVYVCIMLICTWKCLILNQIPIPDLGKLEKIRGYMFSTELRKSKPKFYRFTKISRGLVLRLMRKNNIIKALKML